MSRNDDYTRIGIALNPRQMTRLREISERTGITQTAMLTACIDVLSEMEILEIIKRHAQVKIAAFTQKTLERFQAGAG